jgi:hypothetical protein
LDGSDVAGAVVAEAGTDGATVGAALLAVFALLPQAAKLSAKAPAKVNTDHFLTFVLKLLPLSNENRFSQII